MTKSILITGCSSGIGYTCALGMKARGWRVLATARNAKDLKMLKGEGLEAIKLDYTDAKSIAACAEEAVHLTGGKLYALFNNGAYGQPGLVEDLPVDALRAQFEANVFGVHDLTQRLLPDMIAQGEGRIVQCSSVLGIVAAPYRGAYNASKFALEGLSETLRLELAPTGVKVASIRPGPIRSRFTERALRELKANFPLSKVRQPELYRARINALEAVNGPDPAELESPELSARKTGGGIMPVYRLGPDAVLKSLVHATESANPKLAYHVTYTTHLAAISRRFLPEWLRHKLMLRNT